MERYKFSQHNSTSDSKIPSQPQSVALQALSQLLCSSARLELSEQASPAQEKRGVVEYNDNLPSSSGERTRESLVSRKRTRQGKFLSDISMDDILDNIHLTGKEASKNLGLGLTSFKRVCRFYGIQSWPPKNLGALKVPNHPTHGSQEAIKAQVKDAMAMAQKDIVTVESVELCPGPIQREEMCRCIKEFYVMSCRIRSESGFSIFNDSVLLALLERLYS